MITAPTAPGQRIRALCPACGTSGACRYHLGTRTVSCGQCGWGIARLLPGPAEPLLWAAAEGRDCSDVLADLATLPSGPAPEAPPTVITTHPAPGTFKPRVIPAAGETPADRLARLAAQFELAGGVLMLRR